MPIVVDFAAELIEVTSPTVDILVQDLINAVREAEASERGIVYEQIARASGKEDLGGGVTVGISLELLGNWQVHFWAGNYIAKIAGGNLVGGPGGDPVAYTAGVQVLLIQSAASTIVTSGTGGATGDGFTTSDRSTLEAVKVDTTALRADTANLLARPIASGSSGAGASSGTLSSSSASSGAVVKLLNQIYALILDIKKDIVRGKQRG